MISDIMHIVAHDKGKPTERRGRKSTGLREQSYDSGATEVSRDCKFITRSNIVRVFGADPEACTNYQAGAVVRPGSIR